MLYLKVHPRHAEIALVSLRKISQQRTLTEGGWITHVRTHVCVGGGRRASRAKDKAYDLSATQATANEAPSLREGMQQHDINIS